jgi:hypothetical protein
MNVIKLQGGLGNQLFQYAFGMAKEEYGLKVYYDDTWYERNKNLEWPRPYRLNKYDINVKIKNRTRLLKIYDRKNDANRRVIVLDGCYFDGYWQYIKFYNKILPILRNKFCVERKWYTDDFLQYVEMITSEESVSVHIRRGDYAQPHKLDALTPLPLQYYYNALKLIDKGSIFIFSDEIEWCKEHFNQENFDRKITFVSLEDYLDLELMKLCTHNIISHSTFSWWAAYLNNNESKKVVAPSHWIISKKKWSTYDDSVHYPKEWIKI